MSNRGWAAAVAIFVMSAGGLAPVGAQEKLPPLRTGVDGTFAPHAFPKLAGGIQGFNVDLFTEVAKRMRREITIDSVSFSKGHGLSIKPFGASCADVAQRSALEA